MALDINIQHDLKKLQRDLSALEHRAAPKATVRTLNVLAERSKTASAKNIAKDLGSRQAGVKRRIKTKKATAKKLWATLTIVLMAVHCSSLSLWWGARKLLNKKAESVAWFAPR